MRILPALALCTFLTAGKAEGKTIEDFLNVSIIPSYQEICSNTLPYSANPELYLVGDSNAPRTLQWLGDIVSDIREKISGEFELDGYGIDLDLGTDYKGNPEFSVGIFHRF